jgi:hypothetical protein
MAEATLPAKKKAKKKVRGAAPPPPRPADDGFLAWRTWALAGALMVGGVIAWKLLGTSYRHDIETMCNAEKGSGVTLEHEYSKVTQWARERLGTPEGNELYSSLTDARVGDRPTKLQEAADKAGVSPCPIVASYQQLAATSEARVDMQHLCSETTFPKLTATDDDGRLTMFQTWVDQSARSPHSKEVMAALRQAPAGPARAKVLGEAAAKYEVFSCANVKTLEKPPPPMPTGAPVVRVTNDIQIVGGLREEDVRRAVDGINDKLLACYTEGIGRKPDLAGRALIKVTFDGTGKVSHDEPGEGSSLSDPQTSVCLAHALRELVLPPVGPMASVMVPLELTHAEK